MIQTERIVELLREGLQDTEAQVESSGSGFIDISDPSAKDGRLITLLIRGDSDIEVAIHVPNKKGSPFEQTFAGAAEDSQALEAEVTRFVVGLVTEQVVLGKERGIFKGGRRFLPASELGPATQRRLSWVVSWRGSFDNFCSRRI